MRIFATSLAAVALVPSAARLNPPSHPGPWRPVGKVTTSRVGAPLHFYRTPLGMKALAIVVTSPSSRGIHGQWLTYCEFNSDDDYTETHQGKLRGVKRVERYPFVFAGATHCDVSVNVTAVKGARTTAAVFAY